MPNGRAKQQLVTNNSKQVVCGQRFTQSTFIWPSALAAAGSTLAQPERLAGFRLSFSQPDRRTGGLAGECTCSLAWWRRQLASPLMSESRAARSRPPGASFDAFVAGESALVTLIATHIWQLVSRRRRQALLFFPETDQSRRAGAA